MKKLLYKFKFWKPSKTNIENIKDQSLLEKIAKENSNSEIRIAAIEKIENEQVLRNFALDDNNKIRKAAINKLKDIELILQILFNDLDKETQSTALKTAYRLILIELGIEKISQEEIQKIKNQNYLFVIVQYENDELLKFTALKKIKDQRLLALMFFDSNEINTQQKVLNKIIDDVSKKLNTTINVKEIRKKAEIDEIEDQEKLALISLETKKDYIRKKASEKLKNQNILFVLYKIYKDNDIQLSIIQKLNNENFLVRVALLDDSPPEQIFVSSNHDDDNLTYTKGSWEEKTSESEARINAINKIQNQKALKTIANYAKENYAKLYALHKINDLDFVLDYILKANSQSEIGARISFDDEVYPGLMKKFNNKKTLFNVALEATSAEVRNIAFKFVNKESLISKVALMDSSDTNRIDAIYMLKDKNTLSQIAKNDKNGFVRVTAETQLEKLKK